MTCPITEFRPLQREARAFIRRRAGSWPAAAVPLVHSEFRPCLPDRITALGQAWRRVGRLDVAWTVGLGIGLRTPDDSTHFHADLPAFALHLDYFRFLSWGPFQGVMGVLVSRDEAVAAGGEWGQPPAGGERNWPLGIELPTGELLTLSGRLGLEPLGSPSVAAATWVREDPPEECPQ